MRVGLLGARADRRGLAIQTEAWARQMRPDRVLGFDLTAEGRSPFGCDWSGYDGLDLTVTSPLTMDRDYVRGWLAGLDVVWGAETFYLDEVVGWCRAERVGTVLCCNPEFYRFEREPDLDRPDVVTSPSHWLADRMPGVEVVPFPVDTGRYRYVPRPLADGPLTFVHVAGRRAMHDRDGLNTVRQALKFVRRPTRLLIYSQEPIQLGRIGNRQVDVRLIVDDLPDERDLYASADVLLLPRRYGGQSLKLNEASACGLPTIMTRCAPQDAWLPDDLLVDTRPRRAFMTQAGKVRIHDGDPATLAKVMDRLSDDRDLTAKMSLWARQFAQDRSWDVLAPTYRDQLVRAAAAASGR